MALPIVGMHSNLPMTNPSKHSFEEWTIFGEESIDRKPRPILRDFIQMTGSLRRKQGRKFISIFEKQSRSVYQNPLRNQIKALP